MTKISQLQNSLIKRDKKVKANFISAFLKLTSINLAQLLTNSIIHMLHTQTTEKVGDHISSEMRVSLDHKLLLSNYYKFATCIYNLLTSC